MRISARCDYACKAVLELTFHWPKETPLRLQVISKRQGIPLKYLPQILVQLKRMGIVESIRGNQGGYILARAPEKISLGELVREINGPLLPAANSARKRESGFASIWNEAEEATAAVLDRITFRDISEKVKGREKTIVYEI